MSISRIVAQSVRLISHDPLNSDNHRLPAAVVGDPRSIPFRQTVKTLSICGERDTIVNKFDSLSRESDCHGVTQIRFSSYSNRIWLSMLSALCVHRFKRTYV